MTQLSLDDLGEPEVWLPVEGYEGQYEISSLGRVKSLPRLNSRGYRQPGLILKPTPHKYGYPVVTLTKNSVQTKFLVHRLVAAAFIGPCPDGLEVCHNDSDETNCAASNLRYDTHAGNMQDMAGLGRGCALYQLAKTHCPRGHPYAGDNLRILKGGGRACKQCARDKSRANAAAYSRARRAALLAAGAKCSTEGCANVAQSAGGKCSTCVGREWRARKAAAAS